MNQVDQVSNVKKDKIVWVSKEKAKRMIDEAPSDKILMVVIHKENLTHEETKSIEKDFGNSLIDDAQKVSYQNNDVFGTLSLYGVLKKSTIYGILFPQDDGFEKRISGKRNKCSKST